jgi:steroid delta-isomerase-like uncharacterized protein
MSLEDNKLRVRRWTAEGFGAGNLDLAEELIAEDFVNHTPQPGQTPGRAGVKQVVSILRSAFPDLRVTIEQVVAEGDLVAVRDTIRGTHRGPFAGMPPTGKQVTVGRIAIYRVVDGLITEHWANVDQLGLMQQLGALPAPAPPPGAR